jgi:hypothetical protein
MKMGHYEKVQDRQKKLIYCSFLGWHELPCRRKGGYMTTPETAYCMEKSAYFMSDCSCEGIEYIATPILPEGNGE